MTRTFTDTAAKRASVPLLVGITGPSSSGKTFSALRIARGMQRVVGGDIHLIDSENGRALFYADMFPFRHIDMKPPHGPLDYRDAILYSVAQGAKVVIVDQMTHEHSGDGGVMDQSERFLDDKAGDSYKQRKKFFFTSLIAPKAQRNKLNRVIRHLGVHAIFLYRASEKIKPVGGGGDPLDMGWQPVTTSDIHYDMTARFLLTPGCAGVPRLVSDNKIESLHIKNPEQFKGWWKQGLQLSEEVGERMAQWASGEAPVYRFPSGEHKGKTVDDPEVPASYLVKLAAHEKTPAAVKQACETELDSRKQAEAEPPTDAQSDEGSGEMSAEEQEAMAAAERENADE